MVESVAAAPNGALGPRLNLTVAHQKRERIAGREVPNRRQRAAIGVTSDGVAASESRQWAQRIEARGDDLQLSPPPLDGNLRRSTHIARDTRESRMRADE